MAESTALDTIDFALVRETIVTNDTVKIIAQINATIVVADEAALRTNMRDMMNRLIDGAEWTFSHMLRQSDASGLETVSVTASTRVPERENSNLEARSKGVSKPGLSISSIHADTAIQQSKLDEVASKLRVEILTLAQKEAKVLSDAIVADPAQPYKGPYRVHAVRYQAVGTDMSNRSRGATMKGAMAMAATSYGTGFDEDDHLGNTQKITMTASVTLAR